MNFKPKKILGSQAPTLPGSHASNPSFSPSLFFLYMALGHGRTRRRPAGNVVAHCICVRTYSTAVRAHPSPTRSCEAVAGSAHPSAPAT
jgi:hypothetical protein